MIPVIWSNLVSPKSKPWNVPSVSGMRRISLHLLCEELGGLHGFHTGTSSKIENYLGFPMGVSGQELTNRAIVQAKNLARR
jgi:thioredoxin reductase